jgi:pimeloyl-ACP methyl ester carboxylesterase
MLFGVTELYIMCITAHECSYSMLWGGRFLLDFWKSRFRAPRIGNTQVAVGDRTRGAVVHNATGAYQYYAWNVSRNELTQLTNRVGGVSLVFSLSPDGRWLYFFEDKKGNEVGHYVRLALQGDSSPQDITPDLPQYSSLAGDPAFAINRAGTIIGLTTDSPEGFHLYCVDIATDDKLGQPRLLRNSQKLAAGPELTYDGEVAFWASCEHSKKEQYGILAVDTKTGDKIGELWDGPNTSLDYQAVITSPVKNDHRVLTATDRTGVAQLLIWNPDSEERVDLHIDLEGSMKARGWSPDGQRILFCIFTNAVQQLYVYNLRSSEVSKLNAPGGMNLGTYFRNDGEIWSHWEDSTHPRRLIALDAQNDNETHVVLSLADAQPGRALRSVTFASSDDQEVQGWLGVPDGMSPFPTILETHGGPKDVTCSEYSPESQAWIDNGFAFFSINYRGSFTFGREFEEKIYGDIGFWELEDMVAARNWLIQAGLSRPDMILLTGGSYGGYLTLQALGKRPDLWAGGMAEVPIADWRGLYEDASRTMKEWIVALFGGRPDEKPEQYATSSPITYVNNVRAPIMILQGRNDTRTPARAVEQYAQRLKALNKSVELHWFDAGHLGPFRQIEIGVEHQEIKLRFAINIVESLSERNLS